MPTPDVVIDLGCYSHGQAKFDSLHALAEKYRPPLLLGYDPLVKPLGYGRDGAHDVSSTVVLVQPVAAWTHTGFVGFERNGVESRVGGLDSPQVPCFDLTALIVALAGQNIVLKLDVEGAEFKLLEHLLVTGVSGRIGRLLIEWHDHVPSAVSVATRRSVILDLLECPVEDWWM